MAYLLIVDDTADSRDVLARVVSHAGHEVESVPGGREAIRSILTRTPDLLVLDLLMPEMDGPALLEILRSYLRLRTLPVIVWTAFPDDPIAHRAAGFGVNAILHKGKTSFDDLGRTISDVLPCSS
jgi:CheY-like chemotaxis protein